MRDYIAIDIETTGIDKNRHQIIEIAACHVQGSEIVSEFHCILPYDEYSGEPVALAMNSRVFNLLAEDEKRIRQGGFEYTPYEIRKERLIEFLEWVYKTGTRYFAGKNAASFDLPFLQSRLSMDFPHSPKLRIDHHHRVLDIGTLCMDPGDNWIPDSKTLGERVGFEPCHNALEDARAVVRTINWRFGE